MMICLAFLCFVLKSVTCESNDVFHEKSKITFYPDGLSDYFGYSVVLKQKSLLVGAPKAASRLKQAMAPGLVFKCRLSQLDHRNVTCHPLGMDEDSISVRRMITVKDFFRNDMWFGATIATMPNDKFIACAPRWADPFTDKHLLANGACYVETKARGMTLTPLKDNYRLAFKTDGLRKEYGEYGTHLNFYAYGQAGMSLKVTEMNSVIIGAPGLMQWTGGIVDYRFSADANSFFFNKQPVANPYFTKDLGPDDYFGYSVESGVFQVNGTTLYVGGAPRSKMGYGQVLIFAPQTNEFEALNIKAKIRGPQLGCYFGASLCCTDLNGDGRSDLLVGAPNFIKKDEGLPYDQGAVFVYLSAGEGKTLMLENAGHVLGSAENGARFGTTIAALGDIDGDGYNDVAIGAPWEGTSGAVYIYKGSPKGLRNQHIQKIVPEDARSFGIAISSGVDVDGNNCNDIVIGAYRSNTAYLYRCLPTIKVHTAIRVPNAMNLPQNATNFTALFCVNSPHNKFASHVKMDVIATITIDPEHNRAMISGDSVYTVIVKPGKDVCKEQVVEVKRTADLTEPISLRFDLQLAPQTDTSTFPQTDARLSEDSTLHSSFLIQLVRDCGDDMICTPWLVMTLEPVNSIYVPGTKDRLGAIVTVFNQEEPAYGAKVLLTLPLPPKRVPSDCSLEGENMTCIVPAPLQRGESVTWTIELEDVKAVDNNSLTISAKLEDALYRKNVSEGTRKLVNIAVKPMASFKIFGKTLPNATLPVTREMFYEGGNISFVHYFEVTNLGPSDSNNLKVKIETSENVSLSGFVKGCVESEYSLNCLWSIPAKVSLPVAMPVKYNLNKYGQYLEQQKSYNVTTIMTLYMENHKKLATISTLLVLDPAPPLWPLIVGSIAGFLLLAAIVYGLYKYGFFSRSRRDELKRLQEETLPEDAQSSMLQSSIDADESTAELLSDDSD